MLAEEKYDKNGKTVYRKWRFPKFIGTNQYNEIEEYITRSFSLEIIHRIDNNGYESTYIRNLINNTSVFIDNVYNK